MVVMKKEIKILGNLHFNRIDIVEIKIFIGNKVGCQKAEKYFSLLGSFFSFKLGKSEFNKQCIAVIGRENVHLHNRIITSNLKNACLSKTHPLKRSKSERNIDHKVDINGYQKSCLQSLCIDALPLSPRRGMKPGLCDRKSKDRSPSPLGPNGKPNSFLVGEDLAGKTLEQQSATELLSLGSRPFEVMSVEDGEEVDQVALSPGIHSRSPVTPPFGIPWNGKSKRKVLSSLLPSSGHLETSLGNGELPDTNSLRKHLGQKLEQGLRISLDCVNLLIIGLDTFLKKLVKPSLE